MTELTEEDRADLLDLTWHWQDAYTFAVTEGIWEATPADNPAGILTAESAVELRRKVRLDRAGQVDLTAVRGESMSC